MKQLTMGGRMKGGLKAYALGIVSFLVLVVLLGVLVCFTPLPEKGMGYYMLGALSLACLLQGLGAGKAMGKRGLLFGLLFSAVLVLSVLAVSLLISGNTGEFPLLQLRYLICLVFGGIGGMVGVNFRNAS